MKLGEAAGVSLECSPLLLPLVLFCILGGMGRELLLSALALSLHEAAHTLTARGLGYAVRSIELQPFGFVARLEGQTDGWDELCVAAAGPLCSLLLGACCIAAENLGAAEAILRDFGSVNLAVACLNLLPALPLDGGRMLRSALFRRALDASKLCAILGVILGSAMLLLGVLVSRQGNVTPLLMGLFLLLAALRELRAQPGARMRAMFSRNGRLRRGAQVRVEQIAVHKDTAAAQALHAARGARYTVWQVVDDDMRACGTLDESALLAGVARGGADIPVGTLVDRRGGTC